MSNRDRTPFLSCSLCPAPLIDHFERESMSNRESLSLSPPSSLVLLLVQLLHHLVRVHQRVDHRLSAIDKFLSAVLVSATVSLPQYTMGTVSSVYHRTLPSSYRTCKWAGTGVARRRQAVQGAARTHCTPCPAFASARNRPSKGRQ